MIDSRWRSASKVFTAGLFSTSLTSLMSIMVGCAATSAPEPQQEEDNANATGAVGTCGVKPKTGPCEKAVCTEGMWDLVDLPAGTTCNGTGKCDVNGTCVMAAPPPPTPRVMDVVATELTEIQVDVLSGVAVSYETRNCSAGADPVLHLFQPGATSDIRTQIAVDDDAAGGVNARISLTPAKGGIGFLVLRAKADNVGTCDVLKNGLPWKSALAVGGKTINVVGGLVGDAIETVATTHGSVYQAIYVLSGTNITQKASSGSGTGNSARFVSTSANVSFLVHGSGQPTRVVANDVASDADADGLGDRLEAALGTCPMLSGKIGAFDCATIKTAKDTDGDGLSDAWEVLGKKDPAGDQLLPRWGANPRHKDLFVEVDALADATSPPVTFDPAQARRAAAYWNDTFEPHTAAEQAQHAALVRNPDGLPGAALHFDTGKGPVAGAPESDWTLYGDWGGFSVLPAGTDYGSAWTTAMSPARRGVFHWLMGVRAFGGGQTSGFACTAGLGDGSAVAHELGHTMGIAHYGNDAAGALNCKPQYASVMNYAYESSPFGFPVGFSDGVGPGLLNNQRLTEFGNLAPAPNRAHYADLYENVFHYYVDRTTWSVDFDRDGLIAPAGTYVRAYANGMPNGQCEGTRERRSLLLDGKDTTHSPAIARFHDQLFLFSATDAGLEVHGAADTFAGCIAPGGGIGDKPCGSFGWPIVAASGKVVGVDAVTVKQAAGDTILFTFVDGDGVLHSGSMDPTRTPIYVVDPAPLFSGVFNAVTSEPAMARTAPGKALVVFRTTDGTLLESTFTADVGWSRPTTALGTSGLPFHVFGAPGLVVGRMPGDAVDNVYLHAVHDAPGATSYTFLVRNALGQWAPTTFATVSTDSRPGLAYVPSTTDAAKGKMYVVYRAKTSNVLRMRTSGVEVTKDAAGVLTKKPVVGYDATFDNGWTTGSGVDLMFEQGRDTNLRAAIVFDFGAWKAKPIFQPLADGIVDLYYGSFDDWSQIGKGACAAIANPGGLVTSPMACL